MKCPTCGHGDHRVLRTDAGADRIVRTRECLQCGKRWRTAEVPATVFERAAEIREAFDLMKRTVGEE